MACLEGLAHSLISHFLIGSTGMKPRLTSFFLCLGLVCAPAWAENNQQLTLDAAIERVAQGHPELRLIEGQRRVLDARAEIAAQRPQMTAGLELENVLGSGSYKGADQAELSVSLAGTLERGGKLDARRVLASANIDQLAPQREMARLDLLAETARRYLVIAGAVQQQRIAKLDITHRQRAVDAARRRHQAGGAPESVVLTAQSSLAEAELDRDSAAQAERAARQSLSALWNSTTPAAGDVTGEPKAMNSRPKMSTSTTGTTTERRLLAEISCSNVPPYSTQ